MLEQENAPPKRLLADAELDKAILKRRPRDIFVRTAASGVQGPCLVVRLRAARTSDGRPLRMLNLVDEFTQECLGIDDVLQRLTGLFISRGVPDHVRSDNGSEFTATAVREWPARVGVKTLYIEQGSPGENGYVGESFNGNLRDELLNGEVFDTLLEAKVLIERWRAQYNMRRPHSSLDYRPPAPEATWPRPPSAGAKPRRTEAVEINQGKLR